MTTRATSEITTRRPRAPRTLRADFLQRAIERLERATTITWPSPRWRDDPVGFARDVLGVALTDQQIGIVEAIRDHRSVAVASCNKAGKTEAAAVAALWFYCSFDDARVILSAPTARQVDGLLWRAVRRLVRQARIPIDGASTIGQLARTGLRAPDLREIIGFATNEPEAVAGVSAKNLLYLIDEASGVPDALIDAARGNLAGGGRIAMISNPTRTIGRFAEAFHDRAASWHTIQISALDTPNVKAGRIVIKGLADPTWIDEMRAEYGEDSPFYQIRVLGKFVRNEAGKCVSLNVIAEAQQRWDDTPAEGRLFIGIDPAGPGVHGDETAFAIRRGNKLLQVIGFRGLTEDAIMSTALGFVEQHRKPREPAPVIVIDREGPIGAPLYHSMRARAERDGIVVAGVRASDRALRKPEIYDRAGDELWANLGDWLRNGGAIPPDAKLERELNTPSWRTAINGRTKITPKSETRELLGRSPDRADALCLACWEPRHLIGDQPAEPRAESYAPTLDPYADVGHQMDPYAALDAWRPGR